MISKGGGGENAQEISFSSIHTPVITLVIAKLR